MRVSVCVCMCVCAEDGIGKMRIMRAIPLCISFGAISAQGGLRSPAPAAEFTFFSVIGCLPSEITLTYQAWRLFAVRVRRFCRGS